MEKTLIAKDIVAKIAAVRGENGMRNLLIWGEREWGGKTLVAIGNDYGLSQERVRQIHAHMTRVVNNFMKKEGLA